MTWYIIHLDKYSPLYITPLWEDVKGTIDNNSIVYKSNDIVFCRDTNVDIDLKQYERVNVNDHKEELIFENNIIYYTMTFHFPHHAITLYFFKKTDAKTFLKARPFLVNEILSTKQRDRSLFRSSSSAPIIEIEKSKLDSFLRQCLPAHPMASLISYPKQYIMSKKELKEYQSKQYPKLYEPYINTDTTDINYNVLPAARMLRFDQQLKRAKKQDLKWLETFIKEEPSEEDNLRPEWQKVKQRADHLCNKLNGHTKKDLIEFAKQLGLNSMGISRYTKASQEIINQAVRTGIAPEDLAESEGIKLKLKKGKALSKTQICAMISKYIKSTH